MKAILRLIPAGLLHFLVKRRLRDYNKFKRFFVGQSPDEVEILRNKYLMYSFKKNSRRVPQYQKFIRDKGINLSKIKNVDDFLKIVPETNKHNYIFEANHISNLCVGGDYKRINMLVKSSGHSGRQCYWAKSHQEDLFGKTALSIGLDQNFNISKKKTLVVNGFILGSWVTGITFNEFASAHTTVVNIGPDKEEILQTIKEVGNQFEQIIITGYPPFIKDLTDHAEKTKFPWKKFKIFFGAGGEAFPEAWRDYIENKTGAKKIRSGFGASDVGILGGMETDDSVEIRRLADKNKDIRNEVFGNVDETPMLFQYPLNLFVNTNKKQELVFTTILPEAVQPLIKYNLQDIGGLISYKGMQRKLEKFGIKRKFKLPLPFLYIVGRKSGPVKFHAFLIYPENVEDCIYKNKQIAKTTTGAFRMKSIVDKKHDHSLQIEFQLKKGVKKNASLLKQYVDLSVNTLQEVNGGYKVTYKRVGPKSKPKIILYEFDKYPYSSKIKNVYTK